MNLEEALSHWARALRPAGQPPESILEIVHRLGISVSLRMQTVRRSLSAEIDLRSQPPQIVLYRFSSVDGNREIRPYEDSLLTSRERFSIAHELGHWIAITHLGFPIQLDHRQYWEHESVINRFASQLLVPDWLVEKWLRETPDGTPVPPFALRFWASSICGTSEEVITKAIVRHRPSAGFLRLLPTRSKAGASVLLVLSSAAGSALQLPVERTHIKEPSLSCLLSERKVGSASLRHLSLGRCMPQDLSLAWRRGNPVNSRETIWISMTRYRDHPETTLGPTAQLSLMGSLEFA